MADAQLSHPSRQAERYWSRVGCHDRPAGTWQHAGRARGPGAARGLPRPGPHISVGRESWRRKRRPRRNRRREMEARASYWGRAVRNSFQNSQGPTISPSGWMAFGRFCFDEQTCLIGRAASRRLGLSRNWTRYLPTALKRERIRLLKRGGCREGVLSRLPCGDCAGCDLGDCSQQCAGTGGPGICHAPYTRVGD
jgi:hypothetical protein